MQGAVDDCESAQEGVGLLPDDRHLLRDRIVAVFGLDHEMVAKILGNLFCLAGITGAVGAGINFDQGNNIRIDSTYKGDDALQIDSGFFEEPSVRNGQVEALFVSGAVADIVEKESHDLYHTCFVRGWQMAGTISGICILMISYPHCIWYINRR